MINSMVEFFVGVMCCLACMFYDTFTSRKRIMKKKILRKRLKKGHLIQKQIKRKKRCILINVAATKKQKFN